MLSKFSVALFLIAVALAFGFPIAEIVVHGSNLSLWPATVRPPEDWFDAMIQTYGLASLRAYRDLLLGRTEAFGPLGPTVFGAIFAIPALAFVACFIPYYGPRRDPAATYGDARWATWRERNRMRVGLELGLDPNTRRPVRIMPSSHLITVAPPRTGKTSGLLIPNLLVPDHTAWSGPAFVLDPKAEAFAATRLRREQLGRTVRCLDPVGIAGGADTWNPLARMNPRNVLYLQRVARALLPDVQPGTEAAYFHNRAVVLLVGAFIAAYSLNKSFPAAVARLLEDPKLLAASLAPIKGVAAGNAKAILRMDPRARDSIVSTAAQAFEWCTDLRLQRMTRTSSFSLRGLCSGDADLFVTMPTEDIATLKPLVRWLLLDLFTTVRRCRPLEPLICFIDEAAALGAYKEMVIAAGELPGYNARIWSFWQGRSQIRSTYGDEDADTLLNTAEIVTYSDLPLVAPDEREFVSKAVGDFTLMERGETTSEGKTSVAYRPTAVRLLTADGVGQIPNTQHLILPNSPNYPRRPLLIEKTRFDDPRLDPLRSK
ncbi:type IV secretion system protein VirD4 [Bradyrhizobium japonicum]|uniref:type IV secretory system conjugative DNA transfer family protein n=1 Tax=Bradyrhizobium japonicum TaxID=375 RepID=UPI003396BF32